MDQITLTIRIDPHNLKPKCAKVFTVFKYHGRNMNIEWKEETPNPVGLKQDDTMLKDIQNMHQQEISVVNVPSGDGVYAYSSDNTNVETCSTSRNVTDTRIQSSPDSEKSGLDVLAEVVSYMSSDNSSVVCSNAV